MDIVICDSCGERAGNPYRILDGRSLCRHCYDAIKAGAPMPPKRDEDDLVIIGWRDRG